MIRLYRMDCLNAIKLLAVLTFLHATSGQTVTVSGPSRAVADTDTSCTCTVNDGTSNAIQWIDDSTSPSITFYSGSDRLSFADKYVNFKVTSLSTTQSVLTIESAEVEDDDGVYRCVIPSDPIGDTLDLVIEVASNVTVNLTSTVTTDNEDMYVATCDAIGGKPQETITWTLNGVAQTNGSGKTINETNPTAITPLSNTKSVFTFPATLVNYGQTLVCKVSGHQITGLNGNKSKDLDIHTSPSAVGTTVTVDYKPVTQGTGIIVSCNAEIQPAPAMRIYSIFSNGTSIHESMEGGNEVTVADPIEGTEYTCMAGNYLGNTPLSGAVTYDPSRTTTPPPTTATEGTSPVVDSGTPGTEPEGLSAGAVAGIVIGVIACIVIIIVVILYLVKPECCPCFATAGLKSSGSGKKPAGSAVGSSNGSEKDKINQPVAAQRSQAPIQHTASNPGQELYALPERKQPAGGRGGDAPDRGSGPGQNEPQDIFYAALDLSSKAGHTEKHIPKNENDVVVYSSILV